MKRITLVALLATLGLTGCGPEHHNYMLLKYVTADSAPVQAVDKNAQAEIAQAASSVSNSLQNLDAMVIATHKHVNMPVPVNATAVDMAQIVSITWHGPVQPLLKQIAKASNYHLNVLGTPPSIPLLVNINATNETLADVLRDATYQVAKSATVSLYPTKRMIELRYHI